MMLVDRVTAAIGDAAAGRRPVQALELTAFSFPGSLLSQNRKR
jgi:hypothetical protein